jgi:hypothetical protein
MTTSSAHRYASSDAPMRVKYQNHMMTKNSGKNKKLSNVRLRSFLFVWIAAVVSILSFIPAIPKLIPAGTPLRFSMTTLIVIQISSSVIFAAIFAAAGAILAPRIGFRACLADVSMKNWAFWVILKRPFFYGASIGFAGAVIACLVSPDFIDYLNRYPFLTRLLGGLTEEVIVRWGFMTTITWALWRIFQHGTGIPKESLIWFGVFLSQILFAAGHIPNLINFGITNPIRPVMTIFFISLPWGWLFWKYGLESAFIAHASFHAWVAFFVSVKL